MGRRKHRRGAPGHYCWVCDRRKPNERFSGKGHARHICRECRKLGPEALERRQIERHLERLVNLDGIIPRRHRRCFEGYLGHRDPDVRAIAEQYQRIDVENRAMLRATRAEFAGAEEFVGPGNEESPPDDSDSLGDDPRDPSGDDDIPF